MKKQVKNTSASVLAQITSILCGLILPRLILLHYGSEMNGLAHSISQFLQFSVVMELGLGAVIPAAMYKPLAEKDDARLSAIMTSSYRTFRRMAVILAGYILLLIVLFPFITNSSFPWEVSAWMFVCIGTGAVAQYLAGKPERFLLVSDQKGYVVYDLAIATSVLNTVLGIALIEAGCSLAAVKLGSSLLSIASICFLVRYVSCHYSVSHRTEYSGEPIPQKWNGMAQHIAYIVLEYTDVIVLTLFMSFREVSVYSIYYMVITGIKHLFISASYSIQPKLGELLAKEEEQALNRFFAKFECGTHLCVVLVFSCAGLLIVPFVQIYTSGVTDTDYTQPLFAALLTLAHGFQCLRDPYDKLILASGHFRQTQMNYILAACMNLGLSLLLVRNWGLPGVAAGTLAAMVYQTLYMAYYDSAVLLHRPMKHSAFQLTADAVVGGLIILIAGRIPVQASGFLTWTLSAFQITAAAAVITGIAWFILHRFTAVGSGN